MTITTSCGGEETFTNDTIIVRGVLSDGKAAFVLIPSATPKDLLLTVSEPLLKAAFARGEWIKMSNGHSGGQILQGVLCDRDGKPIARDSVIVE